MKAAVVVGRLLESDLEFYNILQPSEDTLYFEGGDPDVDDQGQMEIWWTLEIDDRRWGIKGITVNIKKLVLDGWFEKFDHERGRTVDVGNSFHYEYPEPKETLNIPDADEPSPDNLYRLAKPQWKLSWRIEPTQGEFSLFAKKAVVDVQKHTIEILF